MNAHDTPLDPDAARGHHAATAEDVIEASRIVRRVIQNAMGAPNMIHAPEVQERKDRLIGEARLTLDAIRTSLVQMLMTHGPMPLQFQSQ